MYKDVRQEFGNNVGSLVGLVFWWTIKCREASTSVKRLLNTTFCNRSPKSKRTRTRFRYNRTLNTNRANRYIEALNLYYDELKDLMVKMPGLSNHPHVLFIVKFADETIESLKEDFVMLDHLAILAEYDV